MAKLPIICFDASPNKTHIGIGVYDKTNNVELSYKVEINHITLSDVQTAETMALIYTLKYLHKNNLDGAHIFTDNSSVANTGISPKLIEKYKLDPYKVTLNWVPREFNEHADYASRKQIISQSKVNKALKAAKADKVSKQKAETNTVIANLEANSIEKFRDTYSYDTRVKLLTKLASTKYQKLLLNCILVNQSMLPPSKKPIDNLFLKLCGKLLASSENKVIQAYNSAKSSKQRQLPYVKIISILNSFNNGYNVFEIEGKAYIGE